MALNQDKIRSWGPLLLLTLLLAVAFFYARSSTRAIAYPPEYDAMRDMGIAQSILDGGYPADPLFEGEYLWYGPLTGAIIAALSALLNLAPNIIAAQSGAVINLLLPLSFFLLAATLFDRWIALAATLFLVLVNAITPSMYLTVTYTPWLYAPHLAYAAFFLLLVAYVRHRRSRSRRAALLLGLGLGLTFMIHVGPAMLFGGVLLLDQAAIYRRQRREEFLLSALAFTGLLLVVAFLASMPYLGPILAAYRMHIANPFPPVYMDASVKLEALSGHLLHLFRLPNLLAMGGALLLLRKPRRAAPEGILLYWGLTALLLLGNVYLWQWSDGWAWRPKQLIPGHHFFMMLAALRALLGGYALSRACGGLMALAAKRLRQPLHSPTAGGGALAALLLLLCALPRYGDFVEFQRSADKVAYDRQFRDHCAAYAWLRVHTPSEAVILCEDYPALTIAGPAGRKVVSTMEIFANLYVPIDPRRRDRDAMLDALRAHDAAAFYTLAAPYQVSHVLVHDTLADACHRHPPAFLERVHCQGRFTIYQVCTPPE